MPAQAVEVFPAGDTDSGWRKELFEFLNNRIDQIIEQTHMEKIEDITGIGVRHRPEYALMINNNRQPA